MITAITFRILLMIIVNIMMKKKIIVILYLQTVLQEKIRVFLENLEENIIFLFCHGSAFKKQGWTYLVNRLVTIGLNNTFWTWCRPIFPHIPQKENAMPLNLVRQLLKGEDMPYCMFPLNDTRDILDCIGFGRLQRLI